jgi:hypothetical protein
MLASLTLGRYDRSRIGPNLIGEPIAVYGVDHSGAFTVFSLDIQGISATETLEDAVNLSIMTLSSAIDSTTPYAWLPHSVCDEFERAFGLSYDAATDLYLVDDTIHALLWEKDPLVVLTIGNIGSYSLNLI